MSQNGWKPELVIGVLGLIVGALALTKAEIKWNVDFDVSFNPSEPTNVSPSPEISAISSESELSIYNTSKPATVNSSPAVIIASEVGADYSKLENLLASGKFKEADLETERILNWLASRDKSVKGADIRQVPCTDLKTIDHLWVKYSNGNFGFTVQREILKDANNHYGAFYDRVLWRERGDWVDYDEFTFNLQAPRGHLPVMGSIDTGTKAKLLLVTGGANAGYSKLETCNLQ